MIKLLSNSTINRIAAGEVIERPASVIKELVENSIDAGSNRIDILLERAGKNLIIISDDGVGMSVEDLEIAVERHTTSNTNGNKYRYKLIQFLCIIDFINSVFPLI